jgi:hypothetical protein
MFLLIFVYDIILNGSCTQDISALLHDLSTEFSLKDVVGLQYFLVIEAKKYFTGLLLTQGNMLLIYLLILVRSNTIVY